VTEITDRDTLIGLKFPMAEEEDLRSPRRELKARKTVFVNVSHSRYLTVRQCILEMGWKITPSSSKNLLFWSDSEGSLEFAQNLQRWQFYNHFPGMWSIAHKVELARVLDRMARLLPAVYNFHPRSFMLPLQTLALETYMGAISRRSDRTMIIKPDRGSQGRGIHIVQDYDLIENYEETAVAQVYLSPLLLDNRKFDLRIYVLVTSVDPLRVYIFKEGMVRFCTKDYHAPCSANLRESYLHLTNFSLNKNNPEFDIAKNKKSLSSVLTELSEHGVDPDKLMAGIDQIVRLTLLAAQPVLASSYHTGITLNDGKCRCFEILGFDILIDDHATPWLLEVNCMPSLAGCSEFDADLKTRVISDTLKVIDLDPSFRRRCIERFKTLSAHGSCSARACFDPNHESEIASMTEWRQILPIVGDPVALQVCEKALSAVRDFPGAKRASRDESPKVKSPVQPREQVVSTPRVEIKRVVPVPPPPVEKKAPRPRLVKCSSPPNPKTSRAVVLAHEARSQKIEARERYTTSQRNSIFEVIDPAKRECPILETEERERLRALKQQSQTSRLFGVYDEIRALFLDGRTPLYEGEAGLIQSDRAGDRFMVKQKKQNGRFTIPLLTARLRQSVDDCIIV
jgi:tubulin polyglutamylase TTLL6/13